LVLGFLVERRNARIDASRQRAPPFRARGVAGMRVAMSA
jgi:hypothetical protein